MPETRGRDSDDTLFVAGSGPKQVVMYDRVLFENSLADFDNTLFLVGSDKKRTGDHDRGAGENVLAEKHTADFDCRQVHK